MERRVSMEEPTLRFFSVVNFSGSEGFSEFGEVFKNFYQRFWRAFDAKEQSSDLLAAFSGISVFLKSADRPVGDIWAAIEPEEVWQLARKLDLVDHRSKPRKDPAPVSKEALQRALAEIRF